MCLLCSEKKSFSRIESGFGLHIKSAFVWFENAVIARIVIAQFIETCTACLMGGDISTARSTDDVLIN